MKAIHQIWKMRFFAIALLFLLAPKSYGQTQDKHFDGLFTGLEVGYQTAFSGALIDGVDVVDHELKPTLEAFLGYRKQFANKRLMMGLELRLGYIDGSLAQNYNNGEQTLNVHYKGKTQAGYGLTLGGVLGQNRKVLLYTYGYSMDRAFDINFTEENGIKHDQHDKNGFLRYGIGVEARMGKAINLRATSGRIYTHFDNPNRTDDVLDKTEFTLGVTYQF